MAGIDSSNRSEFSHTRRTSTSQSHQQKENVVFSKDQWDGNWLGVLSHGKYRPGKTSKRQHKSRISQESRSKKSKPDSYLPSSNTCLLPAFGGETMSSDLSLALSRIDISKVQQHPSADAESTLPSGRVEPDRPPSPRSQIRTFQSEKPRALFSHQSGPMDRFLSQEDHLAGFADDPERMKEEGQRLRSLRTNALRLRAQLKIKRKELREKQGAKTTVDEAFIRYVRENRSGHPGSNGQNLPDDTPDAYYTAMQIARDEYGPLEDEYTRIEDILDETEFEMAKIETRLYGPELPPKEDEATNVSSLPQISDFLTPGPASSSFLGLSTAAPDQYEPIHAEYLSRLGDLDLARERLQNMTQEHESLLLEQESRSRVGMELHDNLKAFLANLPAKEAALQGEIVKIELDVDRLRSQCLEAGINLEDPSEDSLSEIHVEIKVNDPDPMQEKTPNFSEAGAV